MEDKAGELLCGGFQGTKVTSQAYKLIVDHKISSMILSRKNAVNVEQMSKLIKDLQYIAYTQGGYKYPIMFAIDQEGGIMNSLFDPDFITQYPSAMALAATGDPKLVYEISKAIAIELKMIGFSIILGPVLDVVTKLSHQLVGVRSFGTTIEDVQKYGSMCARGLRDGGLFTVGKHFPGIGNATVDSLLELPMMGDTLSQIRQNNAAPFANLIQAGLLNGVSVAGCGVPNISPDETHACLSPVIINQLLRSEMGFDGVVISECLEMEALYHSIGLGQGVILAINAGCDLVMVCHDLKLQNEAIESIKKGILNGNLDEDTIISSFARIETLQKQLPLWKEIFPEGITSAQESPVLFKYKYPDSWKRHQELASLAYQKSITLVRDYGGLLPLSKRFDQVSATESILVLSPLLSPVSPKPSQAETLFTGEEVFQSFGKFLSQHPVNRNKNYVVLHTTYTANGLTPLHESLIEKANIVIVFTSEASRNMYQIGIVKYVSILCGANPSSFGAKRSRTVNSLQKPLIVVATSSPYDFFYDKLMGSVYICCYDYTKQALENVAALLMGDFEPQGCIPGEQQHSRKRRHSLEEINCKQIKRKWLVDEFDMARDLAGLIKLWKDVDVEEADSIDMRDQQYCKRLGGLLATSNQKHFVVRNSSLNILYGVVLTWCEGAIGHVLYIVVEKSKRLHSIGKNLSARAERYLTKEKNCSEIRLGSAFPLIMFPGNITSGSSIFLKRLGWETDRSQRKWILELNDLNGWSVPERILKELMIVGVRFDVCTGQSQLEKLVQRGDLPPEYKAYYREASKSISSRSVYEAKIIIALEPSSQNVIGSIILFTNKSEFSKYFPFIDQCIDHEGQNGGASVVPMIGGVIAPVIDQSYANLVDIFKYGLICSAITKLKNSATDDELLNQCIMCDVVDEEKTLTSMHDIGFEKWRYYYDFYDRRAC
ncbi:hypothetical protein KGF57_003891 [Candida theae]|uniref:Glycoside hydrolase family 3 N-terminal domain-containing protein n=1 Tax=Candida theae TaxID=1198502 RepID=A0AAD5BCG5_9ASCO|nr:uncharacterized protein KGF57_003891 [Candida theae]KAI5954866.1 hypothetical protein KGF57_003891 [Candida theae]